MTGNAEVAVVYLARHADGEGAFRRFAESYRRQPAGCPHQLVVLYKGFAQPSDLSAARGIFADLPHSGLELDDVGFDIGSYLEASRRLTPEMFCFLNTHTELLAPGWLALLLKHADGDGVGLAGAMGSYESLFDTTLLMREVRWTCDRPISAEQRERIFRYFDFLMTGGGVISPRRLMPHLPPALRRLIRYPWSRWKNLARVWPGAQAVDIRRFPGFPNPHLRTNGIVVRREHLLRFDPAAIRTKSDANIFESGRAGLTAELRRAGLAVLVVGRDGTAFDVDQWPRSGTFRLGEQQNLLLSDNQSRGFTTLSPDGRLTHRRITWGDYLEPAPPDFPDLGFAFGRASLGAG